MGTGNPLVHHAGEDSKSTRASRAFGHDRLDAVGISRLIALAWRYFRSGFWRSRQVDNLCAVRAQNLFCGCVARHAKLAMAERAFENLVGHNVCKFLKSIPETTPLTLTLSPEYRGEGTY